MVKIIGIKTNDDKIWIKELRWPYWVLVCPNLVSGSERSEGKGGHNKPTHPIPLPTTLSLVEPLEIQEGECNVCIWVGFKCSLSCVGDRL